MFIRQGAERPYRSAPDFRVEFTFSPLTGIQDYPPVLDAFLFAASPYDMSQDLSSPDKSVMKFENAFRLLLK